MDLVKIGKFISAKRKALELTQRQLADKLGVSDKSVSKWERGVCLPDVSLYVDLCSILGISVNEFILGEEIPKEEIIEKSDDNIIKIATDSKKNQINLKKIIAALIALIIVGLAIATVVYYNTHKPQNYIYALSSDSIEKDIARRINDDECYINKYVSTDGFDNIEINCYIYENGSLTSCEVLPIDAVMISHSEGLIMIIPELDDNIIRVVWEEEGTSTAYNLEVPYDITENEAYMLGGEQYDDQMNIEFGSEMPLLALSVCRSSYTGCLEFIGDGIVPEENDFVYYFTIQFNK